MGSKLYLIQKCDQLFIKAVNGEFETNFSSIRALQTVFRSFSNENGFILKVALKYIRLEILAKFKLQQESLYKEIIPTLYTDIQTFHRTLIKRNLTQIQAIMTSLAIKNL